MTTTRSRPCNGTAVCTDMKFTKGGENGRSLTNVGLVLSEISSVLCGSALFVVSLCLGKRRGLLWRVLERRRLRIETGRHDLLREVYELLEFRVSEPSSDVACTQEELLSVRSWSPVRLRRLVGWAMQKGLLRQTQSGLQFSDRGLAEARRLVRNHRLWEMYLIRYADVAPSHVDRDADLIEHVLDDKVVAELEGLLQERMSPMPISPHVVGISEDD